MADMADQAQTAEEFFRALAIQRALKRKPRPAPDRGEDRQPSDKGEQ